MTDTAGMSVTRDGDMVGFSLAEDGDFEASYGAFTVEQIGQITAGLTALATNIDGPRFRAAFMEAALGYLGGSPAPEEGLSGSRTDFPGS